jgi:hypothetical protein
VWGLKLPAIVNPPAPAVKALATDRHWQTTIGQHPQHPTETSRCVSRSISRRVREIVE